MNKNRVIAGIMAATVAISGISVPAFAAEKSTEKEEVIYVNLNLDGSVKDINVVNIFDMEKEGTIIDYGTYSSVKNMNTLSEIQTSGDQVTIEAGSGKLYYEGVPTDVQVPWNIAISYYLDGVKKDADELAGQSGQLKIKVDITENKNANSTFFDGCALQATFTLDTKQCANIVADGATIANVGSDKQITYTILPGNGANLEVLADVTDFEMTGIAINGVRLNMDFNIDDGIMQDKINEITGAVDTLDDGAEELKNGAQELKDGSSALNDGVGELQSGVKVLSNGTKELYNGLSTITKQNKALVNGAYTAFEGICSASETALNAELTKNGLEKVNLTPKNYTSVLNGLLKQMDADAVYNQAYETALKEVTTQVEANADTLYDGYIDTQANSIYTAYIESQADTIYAQVATQIIVEQLMEKGLTQEQAEMFVGTPKGQILVAQAVEGLTDDQKSQIITGAVSQLTDDQKAQIKEGAVASLTDDQKKQIRDAYIEQMMAEEEVTSKITEAVSAVSEAAKSVSELKGQLDSFKAFYEGLKAYTDAVSDAASGAKTLKVNMDTLYKNTGVLKASVGKLNDGVKALYDGTAQLKDGTGEFVSETEGIDSEISDEIDSMITSMTGEDVETESFVSEKNTNVTSVQFVIKTDAIEIPEVEEEAVSDEEAPSFLDKILNLFK